MKLRIAAVSVACAALVVGVLSADTLFTRNGRRLEGELTGVRGDRLEFREWDGRRSTFDKREVDRVEFGWGNPWSNDPGGGRQRRVSVPARQQWTDTHITVRSGQRVWFQASGRVNWGPGRSDGPAGERDSPNNQRRPIPNRPAAALIGRVDRDLFFIGGDNGPFTMRRAGRLQLGINDDYLGDNSGAFQVIVYY